MKFTVIRSKFLEGLMTVQNVVSSKGSLQILSNALIHVENNQMVITTTDLDLSMR
jgi:DNA polymerase-3 subunit beta